MKRLRRWQKQSLFGQSIIQTNSFLDMPYYIRAERNLSMEENNRKRQCDQIVEYIYDHGSITNTEAVINLHVGRLSGRIKDLRDDGWDIVTDMVSGNHSRFAKYRFTKAQRNSMCRCGSCGHLFDTTDAEKEKWREGSVIRVYVTCPKCGDSTCDYEYEAPWADRFATNVWAGREI